MVRLSVSDRQLLPLIVPGAILLIAVGMLTYPVYESTLLSVTRVIGNRLSGGEGATWVLLAAAGFAVVLMVFYGLAAFAGAILRTLAGNLEYYVIDRLQAGALGITADEFAKQWERYLDHLEVYRNPYIAGLVEAMHFEVRASISLIPFTVALFDIGGIWPGLLSTALTLAMSLSAFGVHRTLARFRNRRFSTTLTEGVEANDALNRLIERWCSGTTLAPLRLVLPHWPLSQDANAKNELLDALNEVGKLSNHDIPATDRKEIERIIAAYK